MNMNQAIVCGRLGKDPEMRYTPSGSAVANFSVAVTSYIKKKDGDGYDDKTTWIDITAWGKTAERVAQHAKAGTEVLISGRIDTRDWEDKDGKKQYRTFVTAMNVQIGQGRKEEGEASPAPAGEESQEAPAAAAPPAAPAPEEEEDDLPF